MPFDRSEPNRSFAPAPEPFVSAGDAAMRVVAEADLWQQRRAAVWANEQAIRDALAAVGRDVPADSKIVGAAELMAEFPTAWRDHSPFGGPNHVLLAYVAALEEAADPEKWAARLDREAEEQFSKADFAMDAAAEQIKRVSWAAWEGKSEELIDLACVHVRSAADHRLKGAELKAQAKAKRWEATQAARAGVA